MKIKHRTNKAKNWSPPPPDWLKWNMDVSIIDLCISTIILVRTYSTGLIYHINGNIIDDYLILTSETIAILEAVLTTIQK